MTSLVFVPRRSRHLCCKTHAGTDLGCITNAAPDPKGGWVGEKRKKLNKLDGSASGLAVKIGRSQKLRSSRESSA